ncbi:MAG TPA: DedA family protein [Candidatus Norongarragalinales archaeon]|nr:DedA family protein [Candidatus Norongarragalinales archaeon]
MGIIGDVEQFFLTQAIGWIQSLGGFGILIGMFLESSIIPIPSEAVLVTAGALGFSPLEVAFWGTIGSTLGAMVGYYIGKKGGRPVVDKIGPYLLVTQDKVQRAERAFSKYGGMTVLASRLIPFVPFKVFSITAGILKFDFRTFVLFTFIGTIPRAYFLAALGNQIVQYQQYFYFFIIGVIVAGLLAHYLNKKYKWF